MHGTKLTHTLNYFLLDAFAGKFPGKFCFGMDNNYILWGLRLPIRHTPTKNDVNFRTTVQIQERLACRKTYSFHRRVPHTVPRGRCEYPLRNGRSWSSRWVRPASTAGRSARLQVREQDENRGVEMTCISVCCRQILGCSV